MFWLRPLVRCMLTPVRRVSESAMLTSGNLPMSSDMMTSTMVWLFCLASAAAAKLPLKPAWTVNFSRTTTSPLAAVASWARPRAPVKAMAASRLAPRVYL